MFSQTTPLNITNNSDCDIILVCVADTNPCLGPTPLHSATYCIQKGGMLVLPTINNVGDWVWFQAMPAIANSACTQNMNCGHTQQYAGITFRHLFLMGGFACTMAYPTATGSTGWCPCNGAGMAVDATIPGQIIFVP